MTTQKRQTSFLQIGAMVCTDGRYDQTFLANYLDINVVPQIKRIEGVGDVMELGDTYSMRIWLRPERMAVSTTLCMEANRKSFELIIVTNSVPSGKLFSICSIWAVICLLTAVALEPAVIWLRPERMAQYGLVPSDVTAVLGEQNIEAPTGSLGENSSSPSAPSGQLFVC